MKKHLAMVFLAALLALCPLTAMAGLKEYVAKEDSSYTYEITESKQLPSCTAHVVRVTSQTWQDIPWVHWMAVFIPAEVKHDGAMMFITGGNNKGEDSGPNLNDIYTQVMGTIAQRSGSVTSVIWQVPNQPLFDNRYEDAIIAYTYDRYLKGEGDEWPLLFPMVKSAVRGLDTVQAVVKEKAGKDLTRFMVTGASKRGWTSWLTAAVDARVQAIAPYVIDTLNMEKQSPHMFATYGGYSEQIKDYTEYGLQERMASPEGQKLLHMVDPYAYRDVITQPKMLVIGTNDPYWTIDAANLYLNDLKGDTWLFYQPNVKHDGSMESVASVSEFYLAMLSGKPLPKISWEQSDPSSIDVTWTGEGGTALLWSATSPNRDFRNSPWTSAPIEHEAGRAVAKVAAPESGWIAYYVEVRFPGSAGMPYGLCSKVTVLPDSFPPEGTRTYDAGVTTSAKAETN